MVPFMKWLSIFLAVVIVSGTSVPLDVLAAKDVVTFEVPDARNAFCGKEMQAAFCFCAFDAINCEVMNMTQEAAYEFVERKYREWVGELILTSATQCIADSGRWNTKTRQCTTCTDGQVLNEKNKCVSEAEGTTSGGQCSVEGIIATWHANLAADAAAHSPEVSEFQRARAALIPEVVVRAGRAYEEIRVRELMSELVAYRAALRGGSADEIGIAATRFAFLAVQTEAAYPSGAARVMPLFSSSGFRDITAALESAEVFSNEAPRFNTDAATLAVNESAGTVTFLELMARAGGVDAARTDAAALRAVGLPAVTLDDVAVSALRAEHLTNLQLDKALAETAAYLATTRATTRTIDAAVYERFTESETWREREFTRVATECQV
jgi:hypothetical protein